MSYEIGYGSGMVEPGIIALVRAVADAGYETFSSCEGHPNQDTEFPKFQCVGFYADELGARLVHEEWLITRDDLRCSWIFGASFLRHRRTDAWALGWRLENAGVKTGADTPEAFQVQTVEIGRDHDVPLLVEMFRRVAARVAAAT